MSPLLRVAIWGLGISALGTLPLGTINVAAMHISITEGVKNACFFSVGAAIVEVAYLRLSVVGINWIRHHTKLLRYMNWLAFLVVLALAVSSFIAASSPAAESKNVILNANIHPFLLGVMMSAVNPMQLPFWFGWSTILFGKGILQPQRKFYNWYGGGIGIGTLIGLAVFVWGGQVLVNKAHASQVILNYSIAAIFAVTALVFLYKIIFPKPNSAMLPPGVMPEDATI